METLAKTSVLGLISGLTSDIKTFIRDEIRLARTEVSEKVSQAASNSVSVAVGGFIAYAGLIVLLIGLGFLVSYFLQSAGLNPVLSSFIGLAGTGLLVAIIGLVFLLNGLSGFKHQSLSPERTLSTFQELKTGGVRIPVEAGGGKELKAPTSEEMQVRVEHTEAQMTEKLDELGYRLSPARINAEVKSKIQSRPYSFSLAAMGLGMISGLFLIRRHKA